MALHPEMFGAAADGVTDDTAAFSSAFAAIASTGGGELHLAAGRTYIVRRVVVSNLSHVQLTGRGALKVAAGEVCQALDFNGCSDIEIDGITLNGNRAETTSNEPSGGGLLTFSGCTDVVVRGTIQIGANGFGTRYSSCQRVAHDGNRHLDWTRDQVLVRGGSCAVRISGNVLETAAGISGAHAIASEAVAGQDMRRVVVSGNSVGANITAVQFTGFVSDSVIEGNVAAGGAGANGVKLDNTQTGIVVRNNLLTGFDYGVFDVAGIAALIEANTIRGSLTYGVRSSTHGAVIRGNTIAGGQRGINATGNDVVVADNLVSGTTGDGVNLGDTALRQRGSCLRNYIAGCGRYGIYFRQDGGEVRGNTVRDCANYPVIAVGAVNAEFADTRFRDNAMGNVYRGSDYGSVSGNVFRGCGAVSNINPATNVVAMTA